MTSILIVLAIVVVLLIVGAIIETHKKTPVTPTPAVPTRSTADCCPAAVRGAMSPAPRTVVKTPVKKVLAKKKVSVRKTK